MKSKKIVFFLGMSFVLVATIGVFILQNSGKSPPQPTISRQNEPVEQLKVYEKLVKEEPTNVAYRAKLGGLYFQKGDWEKAIENYTKAKELDPENTELRMMLAIIYWHMGETNKGIMELDEALQLDSSLVIVHFYKGVFLSSLTGREREAIDELKKVMELAPNTQFSQTAKEKLIELGAIEDTPSLPSLLPKTLGGLPLQDYSTGREAIEEINKLHNKKLPIANGYIGNYYDKTKSKMAKLWITESQDANNLLDDMLIAIKKGGTPFSIPETVKGTDTKVYFSTGMGESHYIWVRKTLLVWLSLKDFSTDEELKLLRDALNLIG